MGEDHGPILIANVLAFGITTFWVVILRIGYRIYSKCTDASDWLIGIALVIDFPRPCPLQGRRRPHAPRPHAVTDMPPGLLDVPRSIQRRM